MFFQARQCNENHRAAANGQPKMHYSHQASKPFARRPSSMLKALLHRHFALPCLKKGGPLGTMDQSKASPAAHAPAAASHENTQ